jgi:ribose-phosphate pyrophosphokinase
MIHIVNSDLVIPYKSFVFPGGEIQVKLEPTNLEYLSVYNPVDFHATITSASDLIELALVVDAVDRWFVDRFFDKPKKVLWMPYMPYARQDRVCAPGEALSLKVAANFINSLNFDKVHVSDPHSDVTVALLNNVHVQSLIDIFRDRMPATAFMGGTVLIAPDVGASKKVLKLAQYENVRMVQAEKVRNPLNGEITGTVVHSNGIGASPVLVVDDICDGGKTFIELAKPLSQTTTGKLSLYVTHGIFSKGLTDLLEWYDYIYCPYVFPNVEQNEKLIRI